jgi:RHS repeat-associated protein
MATKPSISKPTPGGSQLVSPWNPFGDQKPANETPNVTAAESKGAKSAGKPSYYASSAPKINRPTGGGALKSIDEKFEVNPVTGTLSLGVPFSIPSGRSGITPDVSLSYDSGLGNGPFGLGWSLSLPSIVRKTSKGIPQYNDVEETDIFQFTGVEDLVPVMADPEGEGSEFLETLQGEFMVRRYWPRTEGSFSRIERWSKAGSPLDTYWRTITTGNVTSLYGKTPSSKIFDPADDRVFAWLLCETYDGFGNAIQYSYKEEDSANIRLDQAHEVRRTPASRSTTRYIKSIKYGNIKPNRDENSNPKPLASNEWMFEVVFDYGDHSGDNPTTEPNTTWTVRQDPFSTYVAGFEVRTYRLCRRILLFHHFKELETNDYLVKSLQLSYAESPTVSVLSAVRQSAHAMDASRGYIKRDLPLMEFDYSKVDLAAASMTSVPSSVMENLPIGLAAPYQWLDLNGTGKPSALLADDSGWFLMQNLSLYEADYHNANSGRGQVKFGAAQPLNITPRPGAVGKASFIDIDGNGRLDFVRSELGQHGFYERTDEGGWTEFRSFPSWPTVNTSDSNFRYLDLTGNGLADIVISEADTFLWFPALGSNGYGEAARTYTGPSEDEGPRVLFSDGAETIYLADFSGDGLTDLVRIRNGDVCYWPNIGYGRFGAKVSMDNAPWMDPRDWHNQSRIRLADIDGSGVADILYFPPTGGLKVYFNQAGNSWSNANDVAFPHLHSLSEVNVLDLFGLGTSCIIWSSVLPGSTGASLQYLDFTHGLKPHLLITYKNSAIETRVEYTSSVMFNQADELAGRPWPTPLPYPIQCVSKVAVYDHLSRAYRSNVYVYHDGYNDGMEREFRGFGKVETTSSEYFLLGRSSRLFPTKIELKGLTSPPTLRIAWYHTGAYEASEKTRKLYKSEYFGASGLLDITVSLEEPVLSGKVGAAGVHQAYRALKGMQLHEETYLLDGSDRQYIPFTMGDNSHSVRMLQGPKGTQPGVFLVCPRESLACQVERNPADPRIKHEITMEVNDFGNITKSATVHYGRRPTFRTATHTADDWKAQGTTLITYVENDYTNSISTADEYRSPAVSESCVYEITGISPSSVVFGFSEVSATRFTDLPRKKYLDATKTPGLRLLSRTQTRYRANDLSKILQLGTLESLALSGESHILAMTPDIVQAAFQNSTTGSVLEDLDVLNRLGGDGAGYVDVELDESWWVPAGDERYSHNVNATKQEELAAARASFYQPVLFRDPFKGQQRVFFDDYFLHPIKTESAAGNTTTCLMNYRALHPQLITDENGNQASYAFDELGQVAGIAVMGKPSTPLGDTLEQFQPFLDSATLQDLRSSPLKTMRSLIGNATSISFSLLPSFSEESGWQPAFSISAARDTHVGDLPPGASPGALPVTISYYDGHAQPLQEKTLVSPDGSPEKWITSGCKIINSRSETVRQYDCAFDESHAYSQPTGSIFMTNFYDPLGRLVASVLPNQTWSKTRFDAWSQVIYDPGDTVLVVDPRSDPDVGLYLSCLEDIAILPTWYSRMKNSAYLVDRRTAELSAAYADKPAENWFDVRGEQFYASKDNGNGEKHVKRSYRDVQGRITKVIDSEGRLVYTSMYDRLNSCVYTSSMETGDSWTLKDACGMPLRAWNSRGVQQRTSYDKARRPTSFHIRQGDGDEFMAHTLMYGEGQKDAELRNLRGKLYQVCDQALISTTSAYDVLGNPVRGSKRFVKEYKKAVDWSSTVEIDDEEFVWSCTFDAMGRGLTKVRTDGSTVTNAWNRQGLLVSVQSSGCPAADGFIIKDIQHNARGQRVHVAYGNGVESRTEYDPKTFMIASKKTSRGATVLQDLQYAADCMGRIVRIDDFSRQDIFFRGDVVKATKEFTYDRLGRLLTATGREHVGQVDKNWVSVPSRAGSGSREVSPSDGKAMVNYVESYTYSPEGNILSVAHSLADKTISGWTRTYQYNEPSQLEPTKCSNRLSSTTTGGSTSTINYEGLDGRIGLMSSMAGFPVLQWDLFDRLGASATQNVTEGGTPETTWYRYDSNNQRVRKVTERFAPSGETPVRSKDHLYLRDEDTEVFRKYNSSGEVISERWSWHVNVGSTRAALIEANKKGREEEKSDNEGEFEDAIVMYMLSDHISSVSLEVDEAGNLISLEEFSPYGATTYNASSNLKIDKRYRFSAKERDTETGLYYFENRYLVPWLGRWLSPDPLGTEDGLNVYCYVSCDPVNRIDPSGLQNDFVLVNQSRQEVLNMDKKPMHWINSDGSKDKMHPKDQYFYDLHKELWPHIKGNGRCELVMKYLDPNTNTMKIQQFENVTRWDPGRALHAEENVFYTLGLKKVKVESILIMLPPCFDKRYCGHNCFQFFSKEGRALTDKNSVRAMRSFRPLLDTTPIFYYQDQTEHGEKSQAIADMRKRSGSERVEFQRGSRGDGMLALGNPNKRMNLGPKYDDYKIVEVGEQEHLGTAQAIVDGFNLVKSNFNGVLSGGRQFMWNPKGVKDEMIEEVAKLDPTIPILGKI